MTPDEITALIKRRGESGRAFAVSVGVDEKTVRLWLTGERAPNEKHIATMRALDTAPQTDADAPPRDERGVSSALALVSPYREPTILPRSGGRISTDDRVAIIGRTGMGKTWLTKGMTGGVPFVFLDSKRTTTLERVPTLPTFDAALPQQIVRLPELLTGTNRELPAWDAEIGAIVRAGNRLLVFDDLSGINPAYHQRNAVGNALKLGREHNVGVWALVQGPRNIPRDVLNMADHLFIFSITDPDDIHYLARRIGWEAAENIPSEKHAALYFHVESRGWCYNDYDAPRRTRREAEHAQPQAKALPVPPPSEPPRLTARAAVSPNNPALYPLITQNASPASIATHLHISEPDVFRRVTEQYGNDPAGTAWLAAFAEQSYRDAPQSGEKILLSRPAIDKIMQKSYEEGRRDQRKQAASAQRQVAATSAAPPRLPIPPHKPSLLERLLLGRGDVSTVPATPPPPPPLEDPVYTGKLSGMSGMPRR